MKDTAPAFEGLRQRPGSDDPTGRRGHTPTLIAAFMHFDLSFMLWVLLGALGIYIAESAGLSPAEKGLMVAVPILTGSLLRIPLGILGDRYGGRRVGMAMLAFLFVPLTLGWQSGDGLPILIATGLLLGSAGASFAVALPLASRWYPPQRQGLVMGIAAAGNGGTVIANLAAPRLADVFGWHNVLGLAMIPLAIVLVVFSLIARDCPGTTAARPAGYYIRALRQRDLWWFCFFYSVTFGGFVGLSSFLPIFFRDQYGLSPIDAGYLTAMAAFVGSAVRPFGGWLADRFGGVRMLSGLLLAIAAVYGTAWLLPPVETMGALLVAGMAWLGLGNGSVFQLVPQRFRAEIGAASGMIGAVGGLGGFIVPILLGGLRETAGSFAPGFVALAVAAFTAFLALRVLTALEHGWRFSWTRGQAVSATVRLMER